MWLHQFTALPAMHKGSLFSTSRFKKTDSIPDLCRGATSHAFPQRPQGFGPHLHVTDPSTLAFVNSVRPSPVSVLACGCLAFPAPLRRLSFPPCCVLGSFLITALTMYVWVYFRAHCCAPLICAFLYQCNTTLITTALHMA